MHLRIPESVSCASPTANSSLAEEGLISSVEVSKPAIIDIPPRQHPRAPNAARGGCPTTVAPRRGSGWHRVSCHTQDKRRISNHTASRKYLAWHFAVYKIQRICLNKINDELLGCPLGTLCLQTSLKTSSRARVPKTPHQNR